MTHFNKRHGKLKARSPTPEPLSPTFHTVWTDIGTGSRGVSRGRFAAAESSLNSSINRTRPESVPSVFGTLDASSPRSQSGYRQHSCRNAR